MQCDGLPTDTLRLRRFDTLDGSSTRRPCVDFSTHPLVGFTLRSLFLSPGPVSLSRPRRGPFREFACRFVRVRCPLAVFFHAIRRKFAACHGRFGFRALLPLRVRHPPAVVTPRTIRCSPGFCLSKDFSLPAPNPPSRVFHSRTWSLAPFVPKRRCPSAVFSARRSAFPCAVP